MKMHRPLLAPLWLLVVVVALQLAPTRSAASPLDDVTVQGPGWEWVHAGALTRASEPPPTAAVQSNGFVWWGFGDMLYQAESDTGRIVRRVRVFGRIVEVAPHSRGATVRVTYEPEAGIRVDDANWEVAANLDVALPPGIGLPWTSRAADARAEPNDVFGALLLALGQVDLPAGALQTRVVETLQQRADDPAAHAAIGSLAQQRGQDPYNPWWPTAQAVAYDAIGDAAARDRALDALQDPSQFDTQHGILLASQLRPLDHALADRWFDAGLQNWEAHGWQPELAGSLILVALYDRQQDPQSFRPADLPRAERLQRWIPFVEGVSRWHAGALTWQDQALAAPWIARSRAHADQTVLGGLGRVMRRTGLAIVAAGTGAIAMLVCLLLGAARVRPTSRGVLRFWRVGAVPRPLLVGVLALGVFVGAAVWEASKGVQAVGTVASAPLSLVDGRVSHPIAVAWLQRRANCPAAQELLRMAEAQPARAMWGTELPPAPGVRTWEQLWTCRPSDADAVPFGAAAAGSLGWIVDVGAGTPMFWLAVLLSVLAGIGLVVRTPCQPPGPRVVVWTLGLCIPGGSRVWGPAGPWILAAWLVLIAIDRTMAMTNGEAVDLLSALAVGSFDSFWGPSPPLLPPRVQTLASVASAWPLLWLLAVGVGLLAERWFPDPIGPRAPTSQAPREDAVGR